MEEEQTQNRNDIMYLKRGMTEIKRIVKGHGDTTGLVGRAKETDKTLGDLVQGQKDIKILLVGDDTKLDDDGGIKGKLREREKRDKVITRFFWIVLGVFISGSGGLIFYTIQIRIAAAAAGLP